MSWLSWLLKKPAAQLPPLDFTTTLALDISGAEFADRIPTKEEIRARLLASGLFRSDAVDWIARDAHASLAGRTESGTIGIIRRGELLSRSQLKAIGYRANAKIGRDFFAALAANDVRAAIAGLEWILHVARSRAVHLHDLRRKSDAGVTRVIFLSVMGSSGTEFEQRWDGVEMALDTARNLVVEHEEEMTRGFFTGVVKL